MADIHSKEVRSYNMSRVKSRNTKPELLVRSYLHHNGLRFSVHSKKIFGKPDLFIRKLNTAIFIHGCFWHGHKNCRYAALPTSNKVFWKNKIEGNQRRDALVKKQLKKDKIKIIELWECRLKPKKRAKTLERLLLKLSE
jgi:DNA mismatch endonuclease, patch repair protein